MLFSLPSLLQLSYLLVHICDAVRNVQRKLGWKEVGDEDDWEVYWTDMSVGIERIMKLSKTQVRARILACRYAICHFLLIKGCLLVWCVLLGICVCVFVSVCVCVCAMPDCASSPSCISLLIA